jgi:hypothetical protein
MVCSIFRRNGLMPLNYTAGWRGASLVKTAPEHIGDNNEMQASAVDVRGHLNLTFISNQDGAPTLALIASRS